MLATWLEVGARASPEALTQIECLRCDAHAPWQHWIPTRNVIQCFDSRSSSVGSHPIRLRTSSPIGLGSELLPPFSFPRQSVRGNKVCTVDAQGRSVPGEGFALRKTLNSELDPKSCDRGPGACFPCLLEATETLITVTRRAETRTTDPLLIVSVVNQSYVYAVSRTQWLPEWEGKHRI